jgi:hypothetical protein
MTSTLQILRTIDKLDKLGKDGVVELLQKPESEFGAGLDVISANLIGLFLDNGQGKTNEQTIERMSSYLGHAIKVKSRIDLMVALEENILEDGQTSWDKLLAMPSNEDETWDNKGRPKNIGWTLDDLIKAFRENIHTNI